MLISHKRNSKTKQYSVTNLLFLIFLRKQMSVYKLFLILPDTEFSFTIIIIKMLNMMISYSFSFIIGDKLVSSKYLLICS